MTFQVKNKLKYLLTLIPAILLFTPIAKGQPSYGVDLHFKLYEAGGIQVDDSTFCSNYRLLGENDASLSNPCTERKKYENWTFDDSTNYFHVRGSIVYNNLRRKLIHDKDTMLLLLSSAGGGNQNFTVDSLVFHSGKYFIEDHHLHHIDLKKAKADYYNWILQRVNHFKKTYVEYKSSDTYKEFIRLRKRYGIASDDFEEKSPVELNPEGAERRAPENDDTLQYRKALREYQNLFDEYSFPNSHAREDNFNLTSHLDSLDKRMKEISKKFQSPSRLKQLNPL